MTSDPKYVQTFNETWEKVFFLSFHSEFEALTAKCNFKFSVAVNCHSKYHEYSRSSMAYSLFRIFNTQYSWYFEWQFTATDNIKSVFFRKSTFGCSCCYLIGQLVYLQVRGNFGQVVDCSTIRLKIVKTCCLWCLSITPTFQRISCVISMLFRPTAVIRKSEK